MAKSNGSKEKENQMTIYFDKRAFEQQEEEQQELEKEIKKQEVVKAVATLVAFFAKPAILMLLWNWLLPGIFGIATIGYFKALGLYLLARLFIDKE